VNAYPTEFSFSDCEVTRVCFDYRVTLSVVDSALDYASISIQTPFEISDATREVHRIDPAQEISIAGLASLHRLLRQTVISACVDGDGTARFAFSSGARITIPPDEIFEAFDVNKNATGEKWISCPGGEIAYWPPSAPSEE
jgi:hypothetical protein